MANCHFDVAKMYYTSEIRYRSLFVPAIATVILKLLHRTENNVIFDKRFLLFFVYIFTTSLAVVFFVAEEVRIDDRNV